MSLQVVLERALPLAVLLVAALSVPVMVLSPTGLERLRALKEERARVEEQISKLSQEIDQLRAEVRRIDGDPSAIEQAARDELGLVRRTELVFQFRSP